MNRPFAITLSSILLIGCLVVAAADWPQWRGPNRDGVSKETGLLKEWPAAGPKLLWQRQDIGDGFATPAVVGSRLYMLGSQGMEDEFIQAIDVRDGKTVWTTRLGGAGANTKGANYPGARSTPTVDGERIFALGSDGDLACLEAFGGQIVWKKDLRTDFGGQTGEWAYAESPLVDGDVLVCTPGGADATLVALNKNTGAVIWKSQVPGGDKAAYASTIVVNAGGVKQYVQLLGKGLVGVDAKSGKFLWRYDRTVQGSPANIPTPVSRSSLVYSATGKGGGGAVEIKVRGGAIEAAEVYFDNKLPTAIGGSVEVNGYLYGTSGGNLICADFRTGDIQWLEGSLKAGSLLYADGRLYWHGENSGEVALVEATPEAFRLKGRFTPPDLPASRQATEASKDGKSWAYPVVADGRLYIRDWNCLWCYDVAARQ
jgi:outer membrane protein assembly factor BamB